MMTVDELLQCLPHGGFFLLFIRMAFGSRLGILLVEQSDPNEMDLQEKIYLPKSIWRELYSLF